MEALPEDLRNVNHGSFFDHDWKLRYTPSTTSRISAFARGRVTGGSSAVNTAIALRGVPSDYDEWASLGNPLWSWEKVLPTSSGSRTTSTSARPPSTATPARCRSAATRARSWCRTRQRSSTPARSSATPKCLDHNDPVDTGYAPHPMNKRGTLRISTAIAYLGPARDRVRT